jgi:anti-anti-sigma regulatory factor
MTIEIEQDQGETQTVPISIQRRLDASNLQKLINAVNQVLKEGAQNIIIELSKMELLFSSGLFALYSIALLMRGDAPIGPGLGLGGFHSIDRDRVNGIQVCYR